MRRRKRRRRCTWGQIGSAHVYDGCSFQVSLRSYGSSFSMRQTSSFVALNQHLQLSLDIFELKLQSNDNTLVMTWRKWTWKTSELRTENPFLALRCSPTESKALRVAAPLPTASAGSSTANNNESWWEEVKMIKRRKCQERLQGHCDYFEHRTEIFHCPTSLRTSEWASSAEQVNERMAPSQSQFP